ncbi:MAG: aldo/keto reductase, partial [Alphaproteobacteria bacterium]|nr:aldo/keto reductase [Alphaproteobacteria bacterium]
MLYRSLGATNVKVSVICLGTMTWGKQNTEAEGHAQLDFALDRGVNFIDAAEMYPIPATKETYAQTEAIIGRWLKARKVRDKVVLATKVLGPGPRFPYVRDGSCRLDRKNVTQAIDDSLKRLQTDVIDLYQLHWPDRKTNAFGQLGYKAEPDADSVPLAETFGTLGEAVKAGKIRYVGLSNDTPWGVAECLRLARHEGLPRPVSIQNPYSLLNRSFEVGLAEIAWREKCGLLAYSPLGMGVLTGKYLGGATPPKARLTLFPDYKRYLTKAGIAATERYVALAR